MAANNPIVGTRARGRIFVVSCQTEHMPRSVPSLEVAVEQITAGECKHRLDCGQTVTLIDTRRPEDFAEWQITHPNPAVRNVPFDAFLDHSGERPAPAVPSGVPEGPLVTPCAIGRSSFTPPSFSHARATTPLRSRVAWKPGPD
jgi:hypothetical protein